MMDFGRLHYGGLLGLALGVLESFIKILSDMGHICPMSYMQRGVIEFSKTNTVMLSRCVCHHPKHILQFLDFAGKLL